ncbi:pectate lyase-like adhesive domain-containing protein [Candidatus Enterococcus mansonii]|uniref:WxL domain-containing protein n=1 Tax=Candidatus Enterococcus mansonii TaxID=1834181 RepID=A0A242CES8_9ENTE|nr:pectate lyase-like adhesive domain-containing protein [Enterococcus sp. 4G2_DIV0659]OTO08764.1 hypothetical protein A5880_001764 [Enterococcus sp. 4G2_DIV0659]
MRRQKKVYFVGVIVALFSILSVVLFQNTTQIKASEEPTVKRAIDLEKELNPLPKSEKELHDEKDITIPQMEAYMNGTDYRSSKATSENKITGDMTNGEYQSKYAALNAEQNAEWNKKYNFRPETNVKHVSTYEEFAKHYEDNGVSKIVLDNDVVTTRSANLGRTESIEIDGQGYLLRFDGGSINLNDLTKIENFGKAFSDVPVFHMHDIQVANGVPGQNTGANSWGFVNGRNSGDWGGAGANPRNGLWRYRVGNVYTPSGPTAEDNQNVRGRLICANRAEVSVWGYNDLTTAAENFYTGGMTYEPFTYYKGKIANRNYSTIWFVQPVGTNNDSGSSTGTMEFNIGEGSFVYLHNKRDTSIGYPGVYEHFDQIKVGKNATYNANIAGSALSFNRDNARFIAEEGATVNLLSRRNATNYPTLVLGSSNNTNGGVGSGRSPKNVQVDFKPKSKVFIVGNNSTGIIGYRGFLSEARESSQVVIDNPETFDIRNLRTNTGTTRAFLGDETRDRGNHSFVIKNSDISIWENSTEMDGAPTYDYVNVEELKVTNAVAAGSVTSTNADLSTQYTRGNFKRISGMNSTPKLEWIPVTDADFSQKSRVLIGYTAVGGEDPFDENGDAKVKPVYADSIRKAYVDYTDTLGNTYTGISTNDNYLHWKKADHTIAGFQMAGKDMKGIPYRASMVNGTLTPYRTGEEVLTTVIDVTPPEPAKVQSDKVTNATKQLTGVNAEPKANIYVDINGVRQVDVGTVADDGSWVYDLKGYLNAGDLVEIFLEDSAGKITTQLDPAVPTTNNDRGNINPSADLTYRDTVFKAAAKYTVEDILPDKPIAEKSVKVFRDGVEVNNTQVGDTLIYTLTATNGKAANFDTVWKNVDITDVIPTGTTFDPSDPGIKINNVDAVEGDYTFDPSGNGALTIHLGDLQTGASSTVTFKVEVTQDAVGSIITNTAKAEGYSPREKGEFIPGPDDPNREHETYWAITDEIKNPGGTVFGVLKFVSAPSVIDFGTQAVKTKVQRINQPTEIKGDLIIQDSRAQRKPWNLTASLKTPLTNGKDTIVGALRYVSKGNEITLNAGSQPIIEGKTNSDDTPYKVNSTWSESGDGLKLQTDIGSVKSSGSYTATIEWNLTDAP